jgi:hypothetical protein
MVTLKCEITVIFCMSDAASTSLGAAHQSLNIAKEHLKVKINK